MNNKTFQTFFDFGFSKVRAGTFNSDNHNEAFYAESEFFIDRSNLEQKIEKIITSLEKNTNEYINNINLMVDSPKMLSIGISPSKKIDGSTLKQENIKFLVQEAKQQILKHYTNYNIAHIIISNYKIDGTDYSYFPDQINCNFISLDLLFICLPTDLLFDLKSIFSKSNILIDQIICSSYAKSINYKDNLSLKGCTLFIDVGFNKTSVISYLDDKIISLNVLPIGGNYITKDISKVLEIDLDRSEEVKINFNQNTKSSDNENISLEILHQIILARAEEILELSSTFIKSSLFKDDTFKMIITGDGLKVFDNKCKNEISFLNNIDFLEENLESVCKSGFRFISELNRQEVIIVPKKPIKQGFFEKLFHLFK